MGRSSFIFDVEALWLCQLERPGSAGSSPQTLAVTQVDHFGSLVFPRWGGLLLHEYSVWSCVAQRESKKDNDC